MIPFSVSVESASYTACSETAPIRARTVASICAAVLCGPRRDGSENRESLCRHLNAVPAQQACVVARRRHAARTLTSILERFKN